MASVDEDPAANTQQFRAYVESGRAEESRRGVGPGLIVAVVVAALVVAGIIVLVTVAIP